MNSGEPQHLETRCLIYTMREKRAWIIMGKFAFKSGCHRNGYIVGIYCKLIPNWIKSTHERILFTARYRPKFEILLGEVFQKYHRVIRQPASISLDYLIVIASIVFIPRVFPRPYHPTSKTSSTQITCWTHWFNQVIHSITIICAI